MADYFKEKSLLPNCNDRSRICVTGMLDGHIDMSNLQIVQRSLEGEILNCVNCFTGQIAVFHAGSELDRKVYQRALLRMPGPERFEVTLNSEPFEPKDGIYIGFGERFPKGSSTVVGFLSDLVLTVEERSDLLSRFGLSGTENTVCDELSECERRRLRLLSAFGGSNRVIILSEPFDNIASEWREQIAQLLLDATVKKRHLVVVASMVGYSPMSWAEHDRVIKTKISVDCQLTVGFGKNVAQLDEILKQVRWILKDEDAVRKILKQSYVPEQEVITKDVDPPKETHKDACAEAIAEKVIEGTKKKFAPLKGAFLDKNFINLLEGRSWDEGTPSEFSNRRKTIDRFAESTRKVSEAITSFYKPVKKMIDSEKVSIYEGNDIVFKTRTREGTPISQILAPIALCILIVVIGVPLINMLIGPPEVTVVIQGTPEAQN